MSLIIFLLHNIYFLSSSFSIFLIDYNILHCDQHQEMKISFLC